MDWDASMNALLDCQGPDGHRWQSPLHGPGAGELAPHAGLLWLPALGVPAIKYRAFGEALAAQGLHLFVHEWRGLGSSSLRPSRREDWGYRELVELDIPASMAAASQAAPGLPWLIGGHSIGGQLAALALAHAPGPARGLVLVATGVPDASTYSFPRNWLVGGFARAIPVLTRVFGHFPGDRLQWAGREAAQLMEQWAGTVRSGQYGGVGLGEDIEQRLSRVSLPRLGLRMREDWLVPAASLDRLLGKLGSGPEKREEFDATRLGVPADHFRWMRNPKPVAESIASWVRGQFKG